MPTFSPGKKPIMVVNHPSIRVVGGTVRVRMSEVDLFCGIAEYPHRSAERVRLALECVANLAGKG